MEAALFLAFLDCLFITLVPYIIPAAIAAIPTPNVIADIVAKDATPATDKAAPVIAPSRILGNLTSNKIRASILFKLLREVEKARVQLISVDPIRGEMQSVINNSIKNIDSVFI